MQEALTLGDAENIFIKYGKEFGVTNPLKLSPDELKKARNQLILKQHPDKHPPNDREEKDVNCRLINAAYDVLKLQVGQPQTNKYTKPSQSYDDFWDTLKHNRERHRKDQQSHPYPESNAPWAQAGYSGGTPNSGDGSDHVGNVNYYKKKAWEISGKPPCTSDHEYTLWNWDGNYFRGNFSVFAVPSKLYEISHMMIEWDDFKSIAVFYTKKTNDPHSITLINLRGEKHIVDFNHESFNKNPGNDQNFVQMLRRSYPQ